MNGDTYQTLTSQGRPKLLTKQEEFSKPTLKDQGLTFNESSLYQKLASIDHGPEYGQPCSCLDYQFVTGLAIASREALRRMPAFAAPVVVRPTADRTMEEQKIRLVAPARDDRNVFGPLGNGFRCEALKGSAPLGAIGSKQL